MSTIGQTEVSVDDRPIAVRESGSPEQPSFVFLHGWPQSGRSFEPLMTLLAEEHYCLALDLPGIGASNGPSHVGDKQGLAKIVRSVIRTLGAHDVILVGHDCGGMIAFSYLRQFGSELDGAAILNTVIPGVSPWEKVIANPHLWHFAFHGIPRLPETVVAGHEREYFDYFFDLLARDKSALSGNLRDESVEAYRRPEALTAGFNWYRAFAEDAKQNDIKILINTPVLYLRGLQSSGLQNVASELIGDCGHFSPEEAPEELAVILRNFRSECDADKNGDMPFIRSHAESSRTAHSLRTARPDR